MAAVASGVKKARGCDCGALTATGVSGDGCGNWTVEFGALLAILWGHQAVKVGVEIGVGELSDNSFSSENSTAITSKKASLEDSHSSPTPV